MTSLVVSCIYGLSKQGPECGLRGDLIVMFSLKWGHWINIPSLEKSTQFYPPPLISSSISSLGWRTLKRGKFINSGWCYTQMHTHAQVHTMLLSPFFTGISSCPHFPQPMRFTKHYLGLPYFFLTAILFAPERGHSFLILITDNFHRGANNFTSWSSLCDFICCLKPCS